MELFVMYNNIFTIEQRFNAALAWCCKKGKRGFKARLAKYLDIPSGYISGAISGDRGFSEINRRKIVDAISSLLPNCPVKSYEDFLGFGHWILDDNDPDKWKSATLLVRALYSDDSEPGNIAPGSSPETATAATPGKQTDDAVFDHLDVRAACGDGFINADYPEVVRLLAMAPEEAQRLIGTINRSGAVKVIIAAKDSMTPTIQPDDLLFVDTSITEYAGEAVYILLHGGELICKRLSLVGKTLTVISDNKSYPTWSWNDRPDETVIVGRVLRALPMAFKTFSL